MTAVLALLTFLQTTGPAPALSGRIIDLYREQAVAGAKVTVVETGASTVSDAAGFYAFPGLPPGRYTVRVQKPPFETVDSRVTVPASGMADPLDIGVYDQIERVEVQQLAPREKPAPGGTQVVREEIVVVPGARGDALQAVQSLPGMGQAGTFNLAGGLIIRGSAPSDSRVFVDGVEVPLLFHFFNLQSILPSEIIGDIVYAPGGFDVEYGRASAGIIEVRSRPGRPEYQGAAELSFINASVFLQGPLLGKTRKGPNDPTFTVAFRRSFIDAILPAVIPADAKLTFTSLPVYYDYQTRLDWQATQSWRLGFFLFGAHDVFDLHSGADSAGDPVLSDVKFRNVSGFLRAVASAEYQSPRVKSRLSLSGMWGVFDFEAGDDRYIHFGGEGLAVRSQNQVQLLPRLRLRAGGETDQWWLHANSKFPRPPRDGDPRMPNFTSDPLFVFDAPFDITYLGAWTALDLDLTSRLTVGAGARYDGYLRSYDHVVQPRGNARLKLGERTSLRASGGLYTRPPDFNEEAAQRELDPERAWQAALGAEREFLPGLTAQLTGFYIWRSDLLVWDTGRLDPASQDRAYVNRGTGRTFGSELFVQARSPRSFGWLSYTLSRSDRRDAPQAQQRLFDFDQTHNLILVGSRLFGARRQWRLGGRFQYTTGKPHTPVTGSVFNSDTNMYSPEYGRINSRRFEAQHQLDVRIDRTWEFRSWKLAAYLDVTNVYAHPAPLQQQYSYDFQDQQPITTIPVLPAIGLRGEF